MKSIITEKAYFHCLLIFLKNLEVGSDFILSGIRYTNLYNLYLYYVTGVLYKKISEQYTQCIKLRGKVFETFKIISVLHWNTNNIHV